MATVENQVVSMFYELKDVNGNLLDSNMDSAPLSFIMGKNQIIIGLEREIANMNQGDTSRITVKAADAYGEYDKKAIQIVPIEQFAGLELTNGMTLYGEGEDGNTVQVIVKEFNDKEVTIDFNHPLAGKDLYFDIEIAEIRDATEDELLNGHIEGSHSCSCGGHNNDSDCCGKHHHDDGDCCGRH
ncbi:MAG: peptidylprolyl isomerase [Campylobacteraceae bacterium]|jgi:FKBP-type peptidyl-prolyl cis-trans isomerase SlyD|nr:peptidylprolyl isomerase [Campylobacteraceae bacterium]